MSGFWDAVLDESRIVAQIRTSQFFDRSSVIAALDRGTSRALNRAGKIVRDKTKSGIKRKGNARTRQLTSVRGRERVAREISSRPPSQPGTPPHTHTGFYRQWVAYAYDSSRRSVVVGALRSHWLYDLHEFGGTHPRSGRKYPARPAFQFGLEKSLPYIAPQFENMIRLY